MEIRVYNYSRGAVSNPFLAVNCTCIRSRDGKRRITYKVNWLIEEKCTDCSGEYITRRKEWQIVYDSGTKDIKNHEQKIISGGFRGNETSAMFLCIDKCKELN